MKSQLTNRKYKAIVEGVQRDYSLSAKIFKKDNLPQKLLCKRF